MKSIPITAAAVVAAVGTTALFESVPVLNHGIAAVGVWVTLCACAGRDPKKAAQGMAHYLTQLIAHDVAPARNQAVLLARQGLAYLAEFVALDMEGSDKDQGTTPAMEAQNQGVVELSGFVDLEPWGTASQSSPTVEVRPGNGGEARGPEGSRRPVAAGGPGAGALSHPGVVSAVVPHPGTDESESSDPVPTAE